MSEALSDSDILDALNTCASEPVHMPGIIQPIGCLLVCDKESGRIRYASANVPEILDRPLGMVLGNDLRSLLGSEIWHGLRNVNALSDFSEKRYFVGLWRPGAVEYAVHASEGEGRFVVEIESAPEMPNLSPEILREQMFLISQIQNCQDQQSLFEYAVRLFRHVTGFDRVMIYKFDRDWNGEVLAEARKSSLEPFLGMRFPHWDIPEQARAIMARIPLRFITDVDQVPIPILPETPDLPPPDIALAQMRGVSSIHMQYLKNMGSTATMTLSVVIEGQLWGIISFHHTKPRIVRSDVRQILTAGVLPVFCLKLGLLRDQSALDLSKELDALQADINAELERKTDLSGILDKVGAEITEALDGCGLAIVSGGQIHVYGETPSQSLIRSLFDQAHQSADHPMTVHELSQIFPHQSSELADVMGALVMCHDEQRGLMVFRKAIDQFVNWAGNPAKTIEDVDGNKRLQPRGSFSTYLETVKGRCKAWSDDDKHLFTQLWPLLSAAERQAFMNDLSRQQVLMIGELNHRVRNILALVKSVSRKARREGGSLESYSQALESRINALAAAHNIGSGAALSSVSVRKIIALETEPYTSHGEGRVQVTGVNFSIRAEVAPIFTLVIHELMTNAVKYGALSNTEGKIAIEIRSTEMGVALSWTESDGPPVSQPKVLGFGSTLIEQAVPYEMGGTSTLTFAPEGLQADLTLPLSVLESVDDDPSISSANIDETFATIPTSLRGGTILIVEDNFVIASALADELEELGFSNTEMARSVEDALDFVQSEVPALALLDINLGDGCTSEPVATDLLNRNVPMIFISGYGAEADLPEHLRRVPVLTKPVTKADLLACLTQIVVS